jgi:hypothetical protein
VAKKILFEVVATSKGLKVVGKEAQTLTTNTDKASRATDNLQKRRDKYMRTEKGAAGISSNSTKNFSKMQQSIDGGGGGGGLVRAYALLAANVFALTAAFGVLSRSAQIDTLTESMERLSATGGSSISAISRNLVEASGGAIAFADSMKQVALATSAGLGQEQILQLTTVAKGASIALGRNLGDSLDRIFRGAIKLEPELLDEIGLFVRVDEESSRYARTLGKSVTSLTQYEKRQAFLNGVIEQGTKKFQDFAKEVQPDAYTKLAAALGDIAQNVTSFLNKALGPLVGFLADSKGLLFGVFTGIAVILLKQAVPALSQFTRNLETSAQTALADRDNFIKAQEQKVAAAKKASLAQKDIAISSQKEIAKATRADRQPKERFKSAAKGALDPKVLDKELNTLDRQRVVKKRIGDLEKSQAKVKGKNAALVQEELNDLRAEEKSLQKVLRLEKERAKIKASPARAGKGTIADIENQKSLNAAIAAGGTAAVLSTAQTQGLGAGFKEFFGTLKSGKVEIDGVPKQLKGMTKASFALKGGIGLLGASFSRLLMFLGPLGIALAVLAPFLPALARMTGLVSQESQALSKSYNALTEQTKNLSQKFDIQSKAINNVALSYEENRKATLAYNKTIAQTSKMFAQTQKDLIAFRRNLSGLGKVWEGFKGLFNLDKESQILKQQSESVKDQLQAAIDVGDTDSLQIFTDAGVSIETFSESLKNSQSASALFTQAQAELGDTTSTRMKQLEELASIENNGNARYANQLRFTGKMTEEEQRFVKTLRDKTKFSNEFEKVRKNLNITEQQGNKIQEDTGVLSEERAANLEKITSALDGAKEATSKFIGAFQATTKVDEITSSLTQLLNNVVNNEDEFEAFFDSLLTNERPEALIFTKEELKQIKDSMEDFNDQGESGKKIFAAVVKEFEDIQSSLRLSKTELKVMTINAEKFKAQTLGDDALKFATLRAKEETKIATEKATQANLEFQSLARAKGISVAQAEELSKLETTADIRAAAIEMGKSGADLEEIVLEFLILQEAKRKEGVATATEATNAAFYAAEAEKAKLDILSEQNTAVAKQAELQAQISNINTRGSTDLTALDKVNAIVNAKREELRIAREQKTIEDARANKQFQDALAGAGVKEGDGSAAATAAKEILDAQLKNNSLVTSNLEDGMKVALFNSFKEASAAAKEGDLVGGIAAGIKAATAEEGAGGAAINTAEMLQLAKGAVDGYRESLMALGPDGEAVVAMADGAIKVGQALKSFSEGGTAEKMQAVGDAIGAVSSIMAANSKAQIAEIDRQIEAEKKRDGKSKESVAKIAGLEQKKEAAARKQFERNKKMQMAQTVVNTAAAITKALTEAPFPMSIALAAMYGAMGAAQLAAISKSQFQGGSGAVEQPRASTITIGGKRSNRVDVSRQASAGETAYLRGGMGIGSNANNFTPGAAMGRKGYANGSDGVTVGERGPEVISPSSPIDIIPNYALGKNNSMNLTFNVSALDGASVQEVLTNNQGAVVAAIRDAANSYGQDFLPDVNVGYGGDG